MRFVIKLYRKQVDAGRAFLHEQPAHAKSWQLEVVRKMMSEVEVHVHVTDQCMYGLNVGGH